LVDDLLGLFAAASRPLHGSRGWKTSFRLFNAVVSPETEAGFMDRAFGQDRDVRKVIEATLTDTALIRALRRLID
jgi:hypothetical protein